MVFKTKDDWIIPADRCSWKIKDGVVTDLWFTPEDNSTSIELEGPNWMGTVGKSGRFVSMTD